MKIIVMFVFSKMATTLSSKTMEILPIILLLLNLSTCNANDDARGDNNQRYNLANLQRWRSTLGEEGETDVNFPKLAQQYFLMQDRNAEKPRQITYQPDEGISFDEYYSDHELEANIPYGIQNVRDVAARSAHSHSHVKKYKTTFQSLCPSNRQTIFLNLDSDYEYRPDHYEEVTCLHPYTSIRNYNSQENKICGEAGFMCIQLNRTIFVTKRVYGGDCWETESRIVSAGCECMWPKHSFGDIVSHH